jgi:hypothetical protein
MDGGSCGKVPKRMKFMKVPRRPLPKSTIKSVIKQRLASRGSEPNEYRNRGQDEVHVEENADSVDVSRVPNIESVNAVARRGR